MPPCVELVGFHVACTLLLCSSRLYSLQHVLVEILVEVELVWMLPCPCSVEEARVVQLVQAQMMVLGVEESRLLALPFAQGRIPPWE